MNRKLQATVRRRIHDALAALVLLLAPDAALAHGELLVRIADLTRQIEAATNHLGPLYLQRGELYRQDQNWAAAEADYARAEQLDLALPVDLCRAKLLADSGQLESALAQFEVVLARRPDNAEAFLGRSAVLLRLGRCGEALADFRRALQLSAQPAPQPVLELARALQAQGRAEEALSVIDECLRRSASPIELQAEALNLEIQNGHFDAALRRLDTILRLAHRQEEWLVKRGKILAAMGRAVDARQAFEAALAAIRSLPPRIQQNPPMIRLKSEIQASLAQLSGAPLTARTNPERP
jgi:Flp pilus assembly protein TadD